MFAGAFVHQIVASNRFAFLIRKQKECVARLLCELPRLFWSIYADRNRTNAGLMESIEISLNAPQLGVADESPVAAIEDQQNAFRGLIVYRL